VEKKIGSYPLKSPSAFIRSISTDPTIPRHPTNPTFFIEEAPLLIFKFYLINHSEGVKIQYAPVNHHA
jgi:hypothetical protein